MRILINTPDLKLPGGVANYYKGLSKYWTKDVNYNTVGHRNGIPGPVILIYDYIKFIFLCVFGKYNVVLLNPSLGKNAIRRDALFLTISTFFKIKTIVFFRGWDEKIVKKNDINPEPFAKVFNKSSKILVLANAFKRDLVRWGVTTPISLTTTKVDDALINEYDIDLITMQSNILFLTRIEEYKGIFTTIDAYKRVKSNFPNTTLTIAGSGSKLQETKAIVINQKIEGVTFLGNISGKELIKAFTDASMYILPSHSEGMPNTVLEAMAFGLPIISRPVGGLVDFFEEDKMGYLIKSLDPKDYADKLAFLLQNPEKIQEISRYNHEYAKNHFMASKVAIEIENLISKTF